MYTENDSGSWLNEDSSRFENRDPQFNLFEPVLELVSAEISKYEEKTGKTIIRIAGACGEALQACKEAEVAKRLGFDAVLLSPGGLGHLTEANGAIFGVEGSFSQLWIAYLLIPYSRLNAHWRLLCGSS